MRGVFACWVIGKRCNLSQSDPTPRAEEKSGHNFVVDILTSTGVTVLRFRLGTGAVNGVAGRPGAARDGIEDDAPAASSRPQGRLWTNASVSRLLTFSMEYAARPGRRHLRL